MARKKSFWKKNYLFFLGLGVGLIFIMGAMVGIRLAIDNSVVNQLQQVTMSTRTNDMFNPIIIDSTSGTMKIELTFPILNMIDENLPPDTWDPSDVLIRFGRIENPILSVYDWVDRGQGLNELYLADEDYDDYCDNPDVTDTYYTHFYIEWFTGFTLMEGFTYILIVDFYDADDEFHMCENIWELIGWFGEGDFPPLTIRPPRPMVEGALLNIVDPPVPEEEVQEWILNCDYLSFFEYQESSGSETTTPTPTYDTGDTGSGPEAGGWVNKYTIIEGMQNWVFLLILVLVFGLLGLIIFVILYAKKKSKK